MFCDKCGAAIGSGAQFCSSCGKSVGSVPAGAAPVATSVSGVAGGGAGAVRTADDGRVQRHIQILASLWLANGILRFAEVGSIFIAGQMLPFLMGWGIPGHAGNWPFNFLPFGLYSIGGCTLFWLGVCFNASRGLGCWAWCWEYCRCCDRHLARHWAFTRFGCCCRSVPARSTSAYHVPIPRRDARRRENRVC